MLHISGPGIYLTLHKDTRLEMQYMASCVHVCLGEDNLDGSAVAEYQPDTITQRFQVHAEPTAKAA